MSLIAGRGCRWPPRRDSVSPCAPLSGGGRDTHDGHENSPILVFFSNLLDGDGLADVFLYNVVSGAWFSGVSLGDGTGDFSFVSGFWSPGWQIHPIRLNQDSATDLFLYNNTNGLWFRATNDGNGDFTYTSGSWSPAWQITPGDYTGDQLTDLFLYDVVDGDWYVAINTGTDWTFTSGSFSPGWTVRSGDFDGDGRTDLFLYNVVSGAWFESLADGSVSGHMRAVRGRPAGRSA